MPQRMTLAALVGLIMLVSGGCATPALYKHANKEVTRGNLVSGITAVHRGGAGEITVCADGLRAERNRGLPPESYGFSFPAQLFGSGAEYAPVLTGPENEIRIYRLAVEHIADDCPDNMETMTALPFRQIPPDYLSSVPRSAITDEMLRTFIDESPEGAMLYVFQIAEPDQSAMLVYRHDTAVFNGSRLVRIELPSETVKPNHATLIALPLAVVADAVGIALLIVAVAVGAMAGVM